MRMEGSSMRLGMGVPAGQGEEELKRARAGVTGKAFLLAESGAGL